MGEGAERCVPACPHAILRGTAHPSGTWPPCLQHPNCAAAPGHSTYCHGREKETISRGGSVNLTFKSPYRVAFISALPAEETVGGKVPGVDAWEAGIPCGSQELCRKWRSVLCTGGLLLCNRLIAAEEKISVSDPEALAYV